MEALSIPRGKSEDYKVAPPKNQTGGIYPAATLS